MDDELPLPDFDEAREAASAQNDPLRAAQEAVAKRNSQAQPLPPASPVRERLHVPSADIRNIVYEEAPHPGFEARFWTAFRVPFAGIGILWLIALTFSIWVAGFALLSPVTAVLFAFPFLGVAAGLQAIYFGQAANVGSLDEGGPIRAHWGLPERNELSTIGLAFAFSAAAVLAPAYAAAHAGYGYVSLIAVLAFLFYWPMALIGVGISGSILTLFRPLLLARVAFRCFRQYQRVVSLSAIMLLPFVAGALLGFPAVRFLAIGFLGPVLAYCTGISGYLMGCLAASNPEAFRLFRR